MKPVQNSPVDILQLYTVTASTSNFNHPLLPIDQKDRCPAGELYHTFGKHVRFFNLANFYSLLAIHGNTHWQTEQLLPIVICQQLLRRQHERITRHGVAWQRFH